MKRVTIRPRDNWTQQVEELGLVFHSLDNPYWDESVYYEFDPVQIEVLETATNALHGLCLEAVQHVIDRNRFEDLHIPPHAIPAILESWERETASIYGRFDLAYDGSGDPKMLEYNADTPTSLFEASVVQWKWLQDQFPHRDQFNSMHEKLLAKMQGLKEYFGDKPLHFASMDDVEDVVTTTYLRDVAIQAGIDTDFLLMDDIGWDSKKNKFVDLQGRNIEALFKLYPWEWLVHEEFAPFISYKNIELIEPAWKMILSNKGILPILWEMFPNHPNLLEATFDVPTRSMEEAGFVRKPFFSREGANIQVFSTGGRLKMSTNGDYGEEGFIRQMRAEIPNKAKWYNASAYPVIGSWVIDGEAAGIGIREADAPITHNRSRFVPHLF